MLHSQEQNKTLWNHDDDIQPDHFFESVAHTTRRFN